MSAGPTVVVVGSAHMDLIAAAHRLPQVGESITGDTFVMAPGGKGGNQACQLALAGCQSYLVGRLGDDAFGGQVRAALRAKGVHTDYVAIDPEAATGASAVLTAAGDYESIIVPGAAARLTIADLDAASPALAAARSVVLQLELPIAVSRYAAGRARQHGARVVLNASPVPDVPGQALAELLDNVEVVVVNRHEAIRLGGSFEDSAHPEEEAARLRAALGVAMVVVTLGASGAVAATATEARAQPAFPASVRDTVGAGDAFLGMFVAALSRGNSLQVCLRWGTAAGALTVERLGAYEALPRLDEVAALLTPIESGPG